MNLIYFMASFLGVLVLVLTIACIIAAAKDGRKAPLLLWGMVVATVLADAWILKSQSVWFWLSLFW
jgi:hypothetical protein